MKKITILVPAYNEEENIERVVKNIINNYGQFDYIVVNDGSKDSTVQVCRENCYPFLDLSTNLGLAGAFQAGMKYAYRHNYDCAIQFDADGQHLPEYIEPLIEAIKENDIAIGSRFVNEKKPRSMRISAIPPWRAVRARSSRSSIIRSDTAPTRSWT